MPSAEIDAAGRIYVAWHDCGFRAGCPTPNTTVNDLVMTRSDDGVTWSPPARVPVDGLDSKVDHLIPGLAVDRATGGDGARLAIAYYFVPNAPCALEACRVHVGFVESRDGGRTWSPPAELAPDEPMR